MNPDLMITRARVLLDLDPILESLFGHVADMSFMNTLRTSFAHAAMAVTVPVCSSYIACSFACLQCVLQPICVTICSVPISCLY